MVERRTTHGTINDMSGSDQESALIEATDVSDPPRDRAWDDGILGMGTKRLSAIEIKVLTHAKRAFDLRRGSAGPYEQARSDSIGDILIIGDPWRYERYLTCFC